MKTRAVILALIPLSGMAFLPSEVSYHFDASGNTDASAAKTGVILLYLFLAALITVGTFSASKAIGKLTPTGRDPGFASGILSTALRSLSLAFSIWFLLLWILVIFANRSDDGSISNGWISAISGILFIPVIPAILKAIQQIKHDPANEGDKPLR